MHTFIAGKSTRTAHIQGAEFPLKATFLQPNTQHTGLGRLGGTAGVTHATHTHTTQMKQKRQILTFIKTLTSQTRPAMQTNLRIIYVYE